MEKYLKKSIKVIICMGILKVELWHGTDTFESTLSFHLIYNMKGVWFCQVKGQSKAHIHIQQC